MKVTVKTEVSPALRDTLHLDADRRRQSVRRRLAEILETHYQRPAVPELSAPQRRRLDAATRNHESIEEVASKLRITALEAYAYILASIKDPRRGGSRP